MTIVLKTACGCKSTREFPYERPPRYVEVPIYKRMAVGLEVRSLDECVRQDIHVRRFEFSGLDGNGQHVYSEVFLG